MKNLARILLVNWYRLEAVALDLSGHTAFIGPNASGKSSILDAVQTVLVGGDKRQINLNPSAGEKSTRSLRDYCLGVVRDPDNRELSAEFRPRDEAQTYLVLCFRERDGSDEISVGLALSARLDEAQERVEGRFIAAGLGLVLSDLLDQTPDGPMPKPWRRLREELRQRGGPRFQIIGQSGDFIRALCVELSDGRRHLDPTRFLRAFRNAITFAPIRNVSDFVRGYILEERPIQVRDLQQALKSYRDIQAKTREAREREQHLEAIAKFYARADQNERLGLAYRWVEQEAAFAALEAEIAPQREQLAERERQARQLAAEGERLVRERARADDDWAAARQRLAATDVKQQLDRIGAERRAVSQQRDELQRQLDSARRGLTRVFRLLDRPDPLPPGLAGPLESLARELRRDEGLLASLWPPQPQSLMDVVARLRDPLAGAAARLAEDYENQVRDEGRLADELRALRERIARLEAGASDLNPATLALRELLAEHGIAAAPLCDRIDLADESWRDALEAFLGNQREALLVDPAQVREAVLLYRRDGRRRRIQGARIVNSEQTPLWRDRRQPGSLAEVVVGDDPHALAYLNRLAGNVQRVATESELLGQDRAITADGMLASNGAVLRLKPLEAMLGRSAQGLRLGALRDQFQSLAETYGQVQDAKRDTKSLLDEDIAPLARHLAELADLTRLAADRDSCDAELNRLAAEEQSLNSAEYARLEAQVAALDEQRKGLEARQREVSQSLTQLQVSMERHRVQLETREAEQQRIAAKRRAVQQTPGLDREEAARRLEELDQERPADADEADAWRGVAGLSAQRAQQQEHQCQANRQRGRERLREYLARWRVEPTPFGADSDDHRPLSTWTLKSLADLRDTQLARYSREAETALREAEQAFRADFVGRLQESLADLDRQLRELNHNLRRRPFHGQYYQFVKNPERDLEPVLNWVRQWTPEQGGEVGGLFDPVRDPNHPHRDAIARIQTLLMEAGDSQRGDEGLADYRRYYHFDVKMTDADGANPEYLSRRIGKGSGGEHQSPFYVAIGAALAAAYRLERDQEGALRGGLALALFDEAFSKLDVQNSVSALGFLDELGLQVVLAAPDEKYGLMCEHMDSIVNVYRDGGNVYIDVDYLKPAARELLAADNPLLVTPDDAANGP